MLGEMIPVDYSDIFSDGLVQPSTRVGRFQKSHTFISGKEDGSSINCNFEEHTQKQAASGMLEIILGYTSSEKIHIQKPMSQNKGCQSGPQLWSYVLYIVPLFPGPIIFSCD